MSFAFSFDLDDDDELATETANLSLAPPDPAPAPSIPHANVSLESLLATLPPLISYTPVSIPLSHPPPPEAPTHTALLRRDLFDARFQVISQDEAESDDEDDDSPSAEEKGKGKATFVDAESDLVSGVYEGGLKTWECSLDLVDCLHGMGYGPTGEDDPDVVRGKSFLELGCGTALPTCAIFSRLIFEIRRSPSSPDHPPKVTRLHLQDYNKQVLSLITLPNLLLAYAKNLASLPDSATSLPAGDIELSPSFLASFESLLGRERIELAFFEGDWSGMSVPPSARYDVVLTSETIYALPSLPPLLALLKAASERTCLVACKRIYFGVGGGELDFRKRVEKSGGQVETVWGEGVGQGRDRGVGRVVMSVKWE